MPKPKCIRVTPRNNHKIIQVLGNRDPRGYDNQIEIWLDEQDRLHIRVLKPDRCYRFSHTEEGSGYIEVVQK